MLQNAKPAAIVTVMKPVIDPGTQHAFETWLFVKNVTVPFTAIEIAEVDCCYLEIF